LAVELPHSDPRRDAGLAALRRSQERGQVRADAEPEVLMDER